MKTQNTLLDIALSTIGGALFLAALIGAVFVLGILLEGLK